MAVILNYPMTCEPAPYFEGDDVGPALLDLINSLDWSGQIPDLHIRLHGDDGILPRLRLLTQKCEIKSETGAIEIVVRPKGACACPCGEQIMHFVPGTTKSNGGAKLIRSITMGYPKYDCITKITNTALDSKGAIIKEVKAS